jgi:hypothetical protein
MADGCNRRAGIYAHRAVVPAYPGWALFAAWWFKPLYERLPMWLLSQRIFGSSPKFADVRSNWRALVADLPAMLTYRRLAPARSFDAPVAYSKV